MKDLKTIRLEQRLKKATNKDLQTLLKSKPFKKFVDNNETKSRKAEDIQKADLALWQDYEEVGKWEECPRCGRDDFEENQATTHDELPTFECECGLQWAGSSDESFEDGERYTSTVVEF